MEIIELSITAEESENYRKITNRLKVLGAVGWIKAYIWAVVYVVIFCAIGLWAETPPLPFGMAPMWM